MIRLHSLIFMNGEKIYEKYKFKIKKLRIYLYFFSLHKRKSKEYIR